MVKLKKVKIIARKYNIWKNKINPIFMFVSFALVAVFGYFVGVYHYQIEAMIGPVFGYNAHSGSIDLSSVQQTYSYLAANYDGNLDINLLIQGANRGLVNAAGDSHTVYMSPNESIEFNNNLHANIGGGIGAEIGIKKGKITVIRTLKNNPAEKAGIISDDTIIKVNNQSTDGFTVSKVVDLIRGKEGSTVKITIKRDDEIIDYNITRAIVVVPSVDGIMQNGIGIITISRFDKPDGNGIGDDTGILARKFAQDFKQQGVKGIILDLRDNGGGHVSAAVDVAGLWLDNEIVLTERNNNVIKNTKRTGRNAILSGIPTVVLVNSASASASEIVAGALKDYNSAKLVGEKTYGKGSVQQPIHLDGGALLKVTVSRWYTPNGKNINDEGIKPDITVLITKKDIDNDIDSQVNAAIKLLKL